MKIELKLFGAFRTLSSQEAIDFDLPENATSNDLRSAIEILANTEGQTRLVDLLPACRFSTETDILGKNAPLTSGQYAILPPVSGG